MSNLGSQQINATYGYLLQVPGGLTGSLVTVQDGSGNSTPLAISSTAITGTFTGGTIDGMTIGGTTASSGKFTTLSATSITLTNALTTAYGGTGLTSYTAGDLPYYASGTALSKLGIGTNGQVLTSNGSAPQWVNASSIVGAAGSNTQIQFNNSGALGASNSLTWDGTTLSATKFAGAFNGTIGATTPSTGAFTTLGATGALTFNTTTNNQSYTTTGAGTITLTSGTTGTINNFNIGGTTAGTGAFTTLSASSTVSGTGFSNYLASPPAIGGTAPAAGAFTSLTSTLDTIATDGIWAKGTLNASYTDGTVVDYATGNGRISVGTNDNLTFYTGGLANTQVLQVKYTGQINLKPLASAPTGAAGDIYYNSTTNQFQGYNGTAWLPVGGSVISNDTATSTQVYPLFANATSGTATTVYTSNANLLYKPSTGELQSQALIANNGFHVNNKTIATSYTIASGYSASSTGPITVNSGVTVTISSGSKWVVL